MSYKIKKYGDPMKATNEATEKGLIRMGVAITGQAKALADFEKGYQTGQTRSSIMYKTSKAKGGNSGGNELSIQPKKNELYVGTAVNHAPYIEFGTRYMKAQPFLGPAINIVMSGTINKQLAKIQKEEMDRELKGKK